MARIGVPRRVADWSVRPHRTAIMLGLLLAAVGVAKYGLIMWPGWPNLYEVVGNWQDPTQGALVAPPQDYILANAVPQVLLGASGMSSQSAYVSVMVVMALVAVMLPFWMPVVRSSPGAARILFVMLAGGPMLALLLTWVGGYDSLCVIGGTLGVLARRVWVASLGWMLFAMGHGTIAVLAFILWVAFLFVSGDAEDRGVSARRVAWAVAGLVVGEAAVWWLTQVWGGVTSRWEVFQLYPLSYYWDAFIAGMPMITFTALGVGWIVLLDRRVRSIRSSAFVLVSALVASLLLPLVALDQTRTIALVTYPMVIAWACLVGVGVGYGRVPPVARRIWTRYSVAAVVVPIVIVGGGQLLASGWVAFFQWRAGFLG